MKSEEKDKTKKEIIGMDSEESFSIEMVERFADDEESLKAEKECHGREFYSKLLFALRSNTYHSPVAAELWKKITNHREDLKIKLGRDVGITVSSLDYLTNIRDKIDFPTIIEENKLDRVAEIATKDELTELYVRGFFDISIKKELEEGKRYGNAVSLIMIDVDDFKTVNDEYGHQKGDEILRYIGETMNSKIRESDIAGRYGGEELAIILPQTNKHFSYNIAERIQADIEEHYKDELGVTISIGVADYPSDGEDTNELIRAADSSLRDAKSQGKNRTVISGVNKKN